MAKRRGLSQDQVLRLTYQLYTALEGGLGLLPSLLVLIESTDEATAEAISELIKRMERGESFSSALGEQPESFSSSYRRVIETAQETGSLTFSLGRLSKTLEQQAATRRRLVAALIYPCSLLVAALIMMFGMLYFVLPMILTVTREAGVEPPLLTRWLIFIGSKRLLCQLVAGLGVGALLLRAGLQHPRWSLRLRRVASSIAIGWPPLCARWP